MVKSASRHVQVILATQSPRLVDEFEANQIVVVEHDSINNCSKFKKCNENELKEWLEHYTLSDLWDMNIIRGNP